MHTLAITASSVKESPNIQNTEVIMLNVGDTAPDFSLPDQDGNIFSLKAQRGKKVLVWFFPKASTPGCTAQGCSLRDNHTQLLVKCCGGRNQ